MLYTLLEYLGVGPSCADLQLVSPYGGKVRLHMDWDLKRSRQGLFR